MSFNQTMERNINSGLQHKLPKSTLLPSPRLQVNTLTQLKIDVAELEKYLQNLAEEKRKKEQIFLQEKIVKGVQELENIAG